MRPLARANAAHAEELVKYLCKEPQSTRSLEDFFEHYQQSNRETRERMVNYPHLFFKSLQEQTENRVACVLAAGPEGKWINELKAVGNILKSLNKLVTTIFYCNQDTEDRDKLLNSLREVQKIFFLLEKFSREHIHAITPNSANHIGNARNKHFDKRHQPQT